MTTYLAEKGSAGKENIFYERNRIKMFLLFITIAIMLLFQDVLQYNLTAFRSLDELIGFASIPLVCTVFLVKRIKLYEEEKIILICHFLFIISGLCASALYRYQGLNAVVADLIIVTKYIGGYFFSRIIFYDLNFSDFTPAIKKIFKLISVLIFFLTLLDMALNIFPKSDLRYFIRAEKLFFAHPTYLAVFCIIVLAYLTFTYDKTSKDIIYIGMTMFVCLTTFRAKAIGFIVVYILLAFILKTYKKINLNQIALGMIIIAMLFSSQISTYYAGNNESPRSVLTTVGFQIATRFFPFGAGFGTFASYISGRYYSPLYYDYKLNEVWGLQPNNISFISDTFWPMVLSQFGYFGVLLFLIIIYCFYRIIVKMQAINQNYFFSCLILFIYLIITSTAESSFVNYYSVNSFFIIGMLVNHISKYENTGQENIT